MPSPTRFRVSTLTSASEHSVEEFDTLEEAAATFSAWVDKVRHSCYNYRAPPPIPMVVHAALWAQNSERWVLAEQTVAKSLPAGPGSASEQRRSM